MAALFKKLPSAMMDVSFKEFDTCPCNLFAGEDLMSSHFKVNKAGRAIFHAEVKYKASDGVFTAITQRRIFYIACCCVSCWKAAEGRSGGFEKLRAFFARRLLSVPM